MIQEIFETTSLIQKGSPELYELLNETPLFLTYKEKDISEINYEQYLKSLQSQLSDFEDSHDVKL